MVNTFLHSWGLQDKDRRQKMLITKPEPVPSKMCSRCNTQKTCEDFYRDASKPDGLQVLLTTVHVHVSVSVTTEI